MYEATADALAGYAYGLLRDRHAAEDAVQQAFLELVRATPTLRGGFTDVRAWLYTSVRYTCLDRLRRVARRREDPVADLPDRIAAADDRASYEVDSELEAALADLTEQQRSALLLRHVEGLSGAEIAEVLGTNRAAIYALTARAERRLRKHLTSRRIARPGGVPTSGAGTPATGDPDGEGPWR